MTVSISFVPNFSAVCASVTSIAFKGISEAQQSSIFLEKSAFLHCLFEGDTGRTSPNAITSLHIRRLGGDKFSSAVRQYGFPYKWVQRVCGIEVSLEIPEGVTSVEPKVDTSAENMGLVVKALKQRFLSQVYLSQQILALGVCVCVCVCVCACVRACVHAHVQCGCACTRALKLALPLPSR